MAILPSQFQPGPAVDPAQAVNVFTTLQTTRRRNEQLKAQTERLAQETAIEASLAPTKRATASLQLSAAQQRLKIDRIAAEDAARDSARMTSLIDGWETERDDFDARYDALDEIKNPFDRLEAWSNLSAEMSKYAGTAPGDYVNTKLATKRNLINDLISTAVETQRDVNVFQDLGQAKEAAFGRAIHSMQDPQTGQFIHRVTDAPDKNLDSIAATSVRQALVIGDVESLNRVLADENVSLMSSVSGSQTSALVNQAMSRVFEQQKRSDEISDYETEIRITGAVKDVEELVDGLTDAQAAYSGVSRAIDLLDPKNGDVYTGMGGEALAWGKSLGAAFGFFEEDVKNIQELRVLLGDRIMARVAQTKGAVSEKEMDLFEKFSANFGNTAEANTAILKVLQNVLKRDLEVRRYAADLRKQNIPSLQLQNLIDDKRVELLGGESAFTGEYGGMSVLEETTEILRSRMQSGADSGTPPQYVQPNP